MRTDKAPPSFADGRFVLIKIRTDDDFCTSSQLKKRENCGNIAAQRFLLFTIYVIQNYLRSR